MWGDEEEGWRGKLGRKGRVKNWWVGWREGRKEIGSDDCGG